LRQLIAALASRVEKKADEDIDSTLERFLEVLEISDGLGIERTEIGRSQTMSIDLSVFSGGREANRGHKPFLRFIDEFRASLESAFEHAQH